jgi:hypothetical protein
VIVAVGAVRMMEVPGNEVVDMIAVRDGFMTTVGSVDVGGVVSAASVSGGAGVGICWGYGKSVLVDVVTVGLVEMAIVQVVDVAIVQDGGVATAGAMLVGVRLVNFVIHDGLGHASFLCRY